jgi:adenine-specific DNA-methyltransferase
MMHNRLEASKSFLMLQGLVFTNIDEREQARLESLVEQVFGSGNSLGPFIWLARAGKAVTERKLQVAHEYVLCAAKSLADTRLELVQKRVADCKYSDDRGRYNRELLRQWGGQHDRREDRPTLYFPIPTPFGVDVYPKRPDGSDGCWRASREQVEKMLLVGDLDFVRDENTGEITVYRKIREGTITFSAPSNILDNCGTSAAATTEIKGLFGDKAFDTAKPVGLAKRCMSLVADGNDGIQLDFFAGSGTTGHAVINLNREDGGRRKFILVEMADYFDTVLLPRIKKVTFTPEWKDGKPKRMATQGEAERSPRIVKVIRLESYEDALNNLTFDDASSQQALELFRDDYLLSYMLKWETRHSETLLNVEKLQSSFSYKLHIHRDDETRERPVDLPETFAYLLGLDVQTRRVYDDGGRRYLVYRGTLRNSRNVVVLWRETRDWTEEDYRRDRDFVKEQKLTEGADEVYTNGDSFIPGACSLDGLFKARMFAPVEA